MQTPDVEALAACPLCAGGAFKPLAVPGHWIAPEVFKDLNGRLGLVQCRTCGLVFTNPRPSRDRLTAFYGGETYECHERDTSAAFQLKAEFLLQRISAHLPAGAPRTLLDYGAGAGSFLVHARARGWQVAGFEPAPRGLASCRSAGLDVVNDLADLPAHAFGLVTLHHVFEHLADPVGTLDDVRRVLAPAGRLYVEVPNARSFRAVLSAPLLSRRFGVDERYRAFPIHLVYYRAGTLKHLLRRSGWTTLGTFTIGMGIDRFFGARGPEPAAGAVRVESPVAHTSAPRRRLRHAARDAYLRLGLGENLGLVAVPKG